VNYEYDLIIVGGGSAGLTAAGFAVQMGASVALVEKHRTGGDCTWTGCVPSKTLLKVAKVAHQMRTAERYGLAAAEPEVDLKAVMAHVRSVIMDVYAEESPEALRADGIDVHLGAARFVDPHTLIAGDTRLSARNILIATGAHPYVPPISGLEEVGYLTYESLWNLETLPRHLVVIGAGPVGIELSQAFRRLGAGVTLVESRDRVLYHDEPAASRVIADLFEAEGINLRLNASVEQVWQDENGIHVLAGNDELLGDTLLVATGRRPNVEGLDLEVAGVAYTRMGIGVNDKLRTSQEHIYAAGDCTGSYQFTHYAGWQAAMAVRNALLPGTSTGIADQMPWTTFTDPEVAHAGLTEEQARKQFGDDILTCWWSMDEVDRARAEGDTKGFVKLVLSQNRTLLGATIVAARAGEMIQEWIVAMDRGLKVGELSNTMHVYPTYSMANMQAAVDIRMEQLMSGISGRVVHSLARLMR
jgi:pyruvate/2-oxoglutarate dehydrogenase complex dihydrolipoamide dehydrogenase (E3) component